MQLEFRADSVEFISAMDGAGDWLPALRSLVSSWRAWQQRTGFLDAYGDTQNLHPALLKIGDPEVSRVLADFDDWRNPAVRNGIVPKLLDALGKCVTASRNGPRNR